MHLFQMTDRRERKPDSAYEVNFWHIPGGTDYSNATPISVFFSEEEKDLALRLTARHEAPPEMAHLTKLNPIPKTAFYTTYEALNANVDAAEPATIIAIDATPAQSETLTQIAMDAFFADTNTIDLVSLATVNGALIRPALLDVIFRAKGALTKEGRILAVGQDPKSAAIIALLVRMLQQPKWFENPEPFFAQWWADCPDHAFHNADIDALTDVLRQGQIPVGVNEIRRLLDITRP